MNNGDIPQPISIGTEVQQKFDTQQEAEYHTHDGINSPRIDYDDLLNLPTTSSAAGSDQQIQFNDAGDIAGARLIWNKTDKILTVDTGDTDSALTIQGGIDSGGGADGLSIYGGDPTTSGEGGSLSIEGGVANTSGAGGVVTIRSGAPAANDGASVNIIASNGDGTNKNGGDVKLTLGSNTGSGTPGRLKILSAGGSKVNAFSFDDISSGRTYVFPNVSTGIGALLKSTVASYTLTNTTTGATIANNGFNTSLDSLWLVNRVFRVVAYGVISTDAVTPGNLTMSIVSGSSILSTTGAITAGLTDRSWKVEALITCRTKGTSGTIMANGFFQFMEAAQGNPVFWEMGNTSETTINNSSGSYGLDLTATWSVADTDNSITCTQFILESIG